MRVAYACDVRFVVRTLGPARREIERLASAGLDWVTFSAEATEVLKRAIPFDISLIEIPGDNPETLKVVACDCADVFEPGQIVSFPSAGEIATGGGAEPLLDRRVERIRIAAAEQLARVGIMRSVVSPLRRGGRFFGFFAAGRADLAPFNADENAFLGLFALVAIFVLIVLRARE
mgnify:CR=1 FL=1